MEIDDQSESEEGHQSTKHKADALQSLSTTGPLSSSIAKLLGSSRTLPSEKDFHFYHNFNEFKLPVNEIADTSQLMLGTIGSSVHLWGKEMLFPDDFDDDAYDWLVNVNDELFERFDASVDEFQRVRKMEEDSGFQLVCGKKKKKGLSNVVEGDGGGVSSSSGVKMAFKDKKAMGVKPKIPFHIPTIPRPQDQFKIVVNNSNQPFEHVWLQKSDDGSRFIHPQERFSALDFVDKNVGHVEAMKPHPIESTPFKLVEEVKDLKELAAKLRAVDEFAVDLEHNQYRSFQGLTCLMQISTRTEDFVIDTLKLRIQIGPYLREVFKDPMKKKVMHGADRDILWLQKDFGIYVCNMFDTGQASRVLKLERNSLEYLLYHFCGVTANKEYQNADWRLRPLPDEMVRYAREDTHYLLYIYDLLRIRLLSSSTESENSDDQLVEVYKRSYDLCMQLYEKELLTDSSYLHIYGLQGADFNAQQLAIVAGLCEWRDVIARAEDESTGYILPNKTILEIAKQKPVTTSRLRHVVKSKHPYLERNLGSVVSIIRHSMQNFTAFEAAVEHLKEKRMAMASEANMVSGDGNDALPCEASARLKTLTAEQSIGGGISINDSFSGHPPASVHVKDSLEIGSSTAEISRNEQECASEYTVQNGKRKSQMENKIPEIQSENPIISQDIRETTMNFSASNSGAGATVQVLKKPSRAFGAMLGNSTAKRKFVPDKMDREEMKLEEIKSTVILPFHSFEARAEQLQPSLKEPSKTSENIPREEPSSIEASSSKLEDVILIEVDSDVEESVTDAAKKEQLEPREDETLRSTIEVSNSKLDDVILIESDSDVEESATGASTNEQLERMEEKTPRPALEMEEGDETVSLSDLSSSFQKCFNSAALTRKPRQADNPKQSDGFLQLKPFDYEAARKQVRFGEADPKAKLGDKDEGSHRSGRRKVDRKKSSVVDHSHKDEASGDFSQGRRRQAFPASGNRSATFR